MQRLELAADLRLHVELKRRRHVAADLDCEIDVAFLRARDEPVRERSLFRGGKRPRFLPAPNACEKRCRDDDQDADFFHGRF